MIKQEEPCEGRLSSTVLWERRGETPLRDPTSTNINTLPNFSSPKKKNVPIMGTFIIFDW